MYDDLRLSLLSIIAEMGENQPKLDKYAPLILGCLEGSSMDKDSKIVLQEKIGYIF